MDEFKKGKEMGLHLKHGEKESYFKGILGGITGALITAVLWQLVAGVIGGNLHLVFGFIMVVFVYYGYFLFGGKEGRAFIFLLVCISLLAALVSFILAAGVQYVDGLQIVGTDSFSDYARNYSGSAFLAYASLLSRSLTIVFANIKAYVPDFFIMLVFFVIGVINQVFAGRKD